jgi:hypothetical protein
MAHRLTLVTIAVQPHTTITGWAWTVDGPAGTDTGVALTETEARAAAAQAAVAVMGRLEVPGGGTQLRDALTGPTPPRAIP